MKFIEGKKIKKGYEILEEMKQRCEDFKHITGQSVSMRGFEDKYGVYLLAKKLLDEKLNVQINCSNKGPDIWVGGKTLEVKASKMTSRFDNSPKGYGWAVKEEQWKVGKEGFDFLVCVAVDKSNKNILYFPRESVRNKFTKGTFCWYGNPKKRWKNARVLDIMEHGIKGLEEVRKLAKKDIKWEGKTSAFEKEINKKYEENNDYPFKKYSFEKLIKHLKP